MLNSNCMPIKVVAAERTFTFTLTETQVTWLVERLKYRDTTLPYLTEAIWKSLEKSLGHEVKEPQDIL